MDRYLNRQEAGIVLAHELRNYEDTPNLIVLALPRGGVPVAFEVAKSLKAPMDVFIVRKLGVPGHSELAMGAVALGGAKVFNEAIIQDLDISTTAVQHVLKQEQAEMARREKLYRGDVPFPTIENKVVILVDDGIATGATIRAAIISLRQMRAAKIVVAVPVAQKALCEEISTLVDDLVCPLTPQHFYAVGAWYVDFSQTEDEEVRNLLANSKAFIPGEMHH